MLIVLVFLLILLNILFICYRILMILISIEFLVLLLFLIVFIYYLEEGGFELLRFIVLVVGERILGLILILIKVFLRGGDIVYNLDVV